jgi:hypothetical protein
MPIMAGTQPRVRLEINQGAYKKSELIQQLLGLGTAFSAETVRIYLDKMTETAEQVEGLAVQPRECSNRLLSKAQFTPVKTKRKAYIPCDIDTSPMNNEGTKKENIGYTYKGFYGYHPIFAYLGAEGCLLSCEMRPGSWRCLKR